MKNLLLEAKREIESLRRQNEILSAKVEVMNLFGAALHALPPGFGGQAMCVDITYHLEQATKEIEAKENAMAAAKAAVPADEAVPHFV